MPRTRSVKPDLFDDPTFGRLPDSAKILFVGLFTQADRAGRLLDEPERLKVRLCGYSTCNAADVDRDLNVLAAAQLIQRYAICTMRLIQLGPLYVNAQHFHVNEGASTLPAPASTVQAPSEHGADTVPLGLSSVSCLLSSVSDRLSAGAAAEPASAPEPPPVLVFPVVGSARTEWPLTQAMCDELQSLFPALDVIACCRTALAWVKAKPQNRKTARGMRAFLTTWLTRDTNRGVGRRGGVEFIARGANGVRQRTREANVSHVAKGGICMRDPSAPEEGETEAVH